MESATSSTTTKNPISLRLYKVLSTSFDDHGTREALQTLSELYGIAPANGETVGGDGVEGEAYPGEYAAKTRRNLRRDMENKLANGSQLFLTALAEVDEKLNDLQTHVKAMESACADAETQLASTNEASKVVLERAGNLRDERQDVEDKKSIISLFLARFTLSESEAEAITSRDVPVGPRFFEAIDKTERIRQDCRVLMAGEDGPTKAGIDIMASTSTHLEQGFDKILRWISNEFRQVGKDGQLDVMPGMSECILRLKKRPELLTEALTILSSTRQTSLLSSFITALTRGGPSGLPRPIELHAHDPMRYVGDMLAWVHQAIAAEREFLETLFMLKGDGRMVGSARDFESAKGEEEEWIQELMDLAVGKICVPLKNRVLQTVRSQESSIVSYKIANLLQFYLDMMRRTIGPDALLTKTLSEITDTSFTTFQTSIEAHSQGISQVPLDPDDPLLTPPHLILDHAQILREIMNVYQSSVLDDEDGPTTSAASSFDKILDVVIDPVALGCIAQSEEKMRLRPKWDAKVYALNCLTYFQGLLEPYPFTRAKQDQLSKVIEGRVAELIEEHFLDLMKDSGLLEVYIVSKSPPPNEPLSRHPATEPPALLAALHTFSLFLNSPTIVHSPRLANLTHLSLASTIHRAALGRVAKAYGVVCSEVMKEGNRYEAAATLLGSERPFGRVYLVRQIFGMEEGEESESEEESGEESGEEESGEEESGEEEEESEEEDGKSEGDEDDAADDDDDDEEEESEDDGRASDVPVSRPHPVAAGSSKRLV
ncbi:COG6-domain-containing protein [Coprinopsis marcescibilis]|uniref:Conserved oligomeric Golgi complex subunit 6 n=1 Tax=Coprinopsis marcescibilis TaxID=230819 RepID=A0A5C3KTN9_COPMA|nr:COG6-domain-containing protein [Coprinopsis marcescibilis]